MANAPIPMRREVPVSAPPSELWPLISNTDRLNKAVGLPAVTQEGVDKASFTKLMSASLFGIPFRWKEHPFEWVEGRFHRVLREFTSGPVERFEGGIELRRDGAGSKVTIVSDFTPRNALGRFLITHATGKRAVEDMAAMVRRFDEALRAGGEPFPTRRTRTPSNAAALAQRAETLHEDAGCNRELASKLLHFIDHAYDDELSRMRPYALADKWGTDRCKTLKVFLHATKAGLLDMAWEVLCPNCAGATARPGRLSSLKEEAHCGSCDIKYGVDFDQSVEVRFSVSPAVRSVEAHTFCVGNPAQAAFAVAQLVLRPGPVREVAMDLASESYVVRNLELKRCVKLRPSESGASRLRVDFATDGELRFKPGEVALELVAGVETSLVRVERESWKEKAARATVVTALQDFRDLFSSEVLAPGVEIGVRSVALLFTDLKGSTALYEKVGDATAYAIVRDHFDYLFEIVKKRDGAVVKTIGDAVMAVFWRPSDAVEAALEMQERVGELNARLAPKPAVVLKIGVHEGPAIAINADGVLDYFGTTANVAARVQNESQGGDVVVSEVILSQTKDVLAAHNAKIEPFTVNLKGLSDHFTLQRIVPHA